MAFTMKRRQAIIDGYLSQTGRNMFIPAEFIDWLSGQPEHEAYPWFYGMDDATAAREHRIAMARNMASGLRIVARVAEPVQNGAPVSVKVREYPALISPVPARKDGGGYQVFDPSDAGMADELRRQGAQALRSWLSRYRGIAEAAGVDLSEIERIASRLSGDSDLAA